MLTVALLIVLTHDAETPRVKPLPKDTATHQRSGDQGGEVVLADPWIGGSPGRSEDDGRNARRSRGHRGNGTGGAALGTVSNDDHKRGQGGGSNTPRRAAPGPDSPGLPTVPGPSGPPAQPTSPATTPSSSEPVSKEPSKGPEDRDPSPPSVEPPLVGPPSVPDTPVDISNLPEIVIEDGEIEEGGNRIPAQSGHVRMLIRSDQLLLVEVEDRALSWLVPAAGEALIEFDTSEKLFKLELRHRKGGLVLRLSD
jgi:hypothetical protein